MRHVALIITPSTMCNFTKNLPTLKNRTPRETAGKLARKS
jgi:hypothetical protein